MIKNTGNRRKRKGGSSRIQGTVHPRTNIMQQRLLHTPEGVRDLYGEEFEKKKAIQEKVLHLLSLYGYHEIQTPTFEFFDIFSREIGTTPSRELYKFFDREGNTLVLRPDMTPSIARCASKYYMEEELPIRFSYLGNTFLNGGSLQGRLKETTQIGAELIGDASVDADAELIAFVIQALLACGCRDFQVSIGQVEVFKGLAEEAGLSEETEYALREKISNKNIIAAEALLEEAGVEEKRKKAFLKIPELFGGLDRILEIQNMSEQERVHHALKRLKELYEILKYYQVERYITFDLGLLSKYNYYTGITFQAYTYEVGEPIAKGGRYDTLLSHFGKDSAAVGCTIQIDQLLLALIRQKNEIETAKKERILLYQKEARKEAILAAANYRKNGERVELILMAEDKTIEDYLAFAKRNGVEKLGIIHMDGTEEGRTV